MANSMAGAIAGSAARSLIDGSNFGDNLIAALPDVIGSAIGNVVAGVAVDAMQAKSRVNTPAGVSLGDVELSYVPIGAGAGPVMGLIGMGGGWTIADYNGDGKTTFADLWALGEDVKSRIGDWVDSGEEIIVTAKKNINHDKQGLNPLSIVYNALDILTQTIARNIMQPRVAPRTNARYEQSLRARAIAGLAKYSSPEGYFVASDHPTNAEFSIRSRMAQYRLVDQISSISGKISPYFAQGSAFDRYVGSSAAKGGAFFQKITIGEGTPADTLIAKPFWGATGLIDHYVDPGMIATLESNGLARLPGAAFSSVKYLNTLKTGRMAAAESTGGLSALEANAPHIALGSRPPYAAGSRARDIVLENERMFVRVHGEGNQARSWMMRPHEIEGLSAQQIQNRFALPELPIYVSDVATPAGTRIRVGTAGSQEGWGVGGGIQYELQQRLPASAFTNRRPLP